MGVRALSSCEGEPLSQLAGTTDDRRAIAKATAELLDAVNSSDVARVVSVWAENGVLMPPNHPPVEGRSAIESYFRQLFARATLTFRFTSSTLALSGDLAVERVTYEAEILLTGAAQPTEDRGKGLHVYRRQPDGVWKLAQDIWSSDRPD